jgi:phosphopantothenoylcysteine decarboxylase/phosphopantothenate--cysteine ligase
MNVPLVANPDILAGLGAVKKPGQTLVGFALETQNGVSNARKKLAAKNADLIVLNTPEAGLGGETNTVTLVEERSTVELPTASKREIAERIWDRVLELRGDVAKSPKLKLAKPAKPVSPRRAARKSRR